MTARIELLVHAGAPSTRSDDENHIAQARSYLAFHGREVKVYPQPAQLPSQTPLNVNITSRETSLRVDDSTTFLDDTQLAYDALDSQLATSSLLLPDSLDSNTPSRHTASTSFTTTIPSRVHVTQCPAKNISDLAIVDERTSLMKSSTPAFQNEGNEGTFPSDESQVDRPSQSSYLQTPILTRSTTKRRVSDVSATDRPDNKRERVGYVLPAANGNADVAAENNHFTPSVGLPNDVQSNGSLDPHAAAEITSELPTSYSLSDISSDSSRAEARLSNSGRTASEPGPQHGIIHPTQPGIVFSSIASHETTSQPAAGQGIRSNNPLNKFEAFIGEDATTIDSNTLSHVNNEIAANVEVQSNENAQNQARTSAIETAQHHVPSNSETLQSALSGLSTSVRPPQPKTSQDKFTSHITDSLAFLVEKLNVEQYYKPTSTTREIRPLERGYWLVDCSSLELSAQIEFWQFIEKTIQRGNAGWGVWCIRGEENNGVRPDHPASSIGLVKVHCWGEIVQHIYLMLYVASKAKARKLGLQWIDAEQHVVVQMKKA